MTFVEHLRIKIPALLKALFGLAVFICADYSIYYLFDLMGLDRDIYRGVFNTAVAVSVFLTMFLLNKISAKLEAPLIRVSKLRPDQLGALFVIAIGMLGFVSTYIGIADAIAEHFKPVEEAVEVYRENVDRYSDTPQIIVPLWDSLLYAFTLSFFVPITEEMAFRGVIFGELRKGFGPVLSVIISAVIFGIMHGRSLHIGYAFVCGVIIASAYHLTGSIVAPVFLHMIFNIFGSGLQNILGLEQLNVPLDFYILFFSALNIVTVVFMPLSVFAFIYLAAVKKRKEADKQKVADYISSREEEKAKETDEDDKADGSEKSDADESTESCEVTEAEE